MVTFNGIHLELTSKLSSGRSRLLSLNLNWTDSETVLPFSLSSFNPSTSMALVIFFALVSATRKSRKDALIVYLWSRSSEYVSVGVFVVYLLTFWYITQKHRVDFIIREQILTTVYIESHCEQCRDLKAKKFYCMISLVWLVYRMISPVSLPIISCLKWWALCPNFPSIVLIVLCGLILRNRDDFSTFWLYINFRTLHSCLVQLGSHLKLSTKPNKIVGKKCIFFVYLISNNQ